MRSPLVLLLIFLLLPAVVSAQAMRQRDFVDLTATNYDTSARIYSRLTANNVLCALVKVQLPRPGCVFEGQIVGEVEYKVNEYWVYMDVNAKRLTIKCPDMESCEIIWQPNPGARNGVESGHTYRLTLDGYQSSSQAATSVREGNFVVFSLTPPDATVEVDGKAQPLPQDGKVSVYLRCGTHSYKVSAYGYASATGTISMGEEKQSLPVTLTSVMASLTVSCATTGAIIYINDERKGTGNWTGTLAAGTYHVEARLDGHRTRSEDITLAENDRRTVTLPALSGIMGSLQVDYQPVDAEVWIDGKKVGTSPEVFSILVGRHTVEIRAAGYNSAKSTVSVTEGQMTPVKGSLNRTASASTPSQTSSSTPSPTSSALSSASGRINGYEYVDLGLSVKWATCNVGAGSPSDYGNYFAWGETSTKSEYWDSNSKTYDKSSYNRDIGGDANTDAARANWGGTWRLPTEAEFDELLSGCTWQWTTQGGHNGYKVTSKTNGNSIFLPAAGWRYGSSPSLVGGYGYYWSSSPYGSAAERAYSLYFYGSDHNTDWNFRPYGFSVRPVSE